MTHTSQMDTPVAGAPRRKRVTPGAAAANAARGMLMGTADVIPGVSGGTVALILGIYERLIDALHHVAGAAASLVRRDRTQARDHWRRAEFGLVLPLGVGIVVAIGIGSVVLPGLIESYPVITAAVFFGLIAGAVPIPWQRRRRRRPAHWALAAAGAVVAFVLAGLTPRELADPSLLVVFGAAAIAVCAMILPGVSGAFLLLVMGMYEPTLEAARALDVAYVGVFVAGAATGLGLFSKLLSWLLDHRHDATMAVLVGLMVGSLRKLWPWQTDVGGLLTPPDATSALIAAGCALAGLALVVGLTTVGTRIEHEQRSPTGA